MNSKSANPLNTLVLVRDKTVKRTRKEKLRSDQAAALLRNRPIATVYTPFQSITAKQAEELASHFTLTPIQAAGLLEKGREAGKQAREEMGKCLDLNNLPHVVCR